MDNLTDLDIEFHNLLAKASKNHVFVIVVGSIAAVLRNLLSRLSPGVGTAGDPGGYDKSILMSGNAVRYHEEILSAIIEKRRDAAMELLEQHLIEVSHRIKTLID